jgi:hypothetical protein
MGDYNMATIQTAAFTNRLIDWYNSNQYRSYPFEEDSIFLMEDNKFAPLNLLLDILVVDTRNTITGIPEMRLSRIEKQNGTDGTDGTNDQINMVFTYTSNLDTINIVLPIINDGTSDIFTSMVTVESPNDLPIFIKYTSTHIVSDSDIPLGEVINKPKILASKIISSTVSGVRSIQGTQGDKATGDIHIVPGCNTEVYINNGRIIVNLRRGAGKGTCCSGTAGSDLSDCQQAFLFFNGQEGDINGNITLVGGAGVVIQPSAPHEYYKTKTNKIIPTIDIQAGADLIGLIGE